MMTYAADILAVLVLFGITSTSDANKVPVSFSPVAYLGG